MWLTEASTKVVGDGKLLNPTTWFGKGSWFTNDLHFPFAWLRETASTAADAAAGASTGAAETATKAADATAAASKVIHWMQEAGLSVRFEAFGIDKKSITPVLLDEINQERFDNNPVAFDRGRLTDLILNYC